MITIEIIGLDALQKKFAQFPRQYEIAIGETMKAGLDTLTASVPPYPVANPDSKYIRTVMLGRSLGMERLRPDIYEMQIGAQFSQGTWGTRLEYAPYVIGEREQAEQHRGRWYTILTIADNARPKIKRLFDRMAEKLAKWLDEQR